ncbi:MAG: T9SS type A sorting domain-containing protein, partial [Candidatus Delongbacteria bacterium]|nr:T9SS type A sorting domain-containing protein [Candidatus Delongbacteria bacterium]
TATSVHSYFNITGVSDGGSDLSNVNGHDFLDGMSWNYTGENSWIDHLAPIAPAVTIFSNPSPSYDCGVAYDSGTYKTMGTSFEITGLGGTNSLDDAVSGIMDFFGIAGEPLAVPTNLAIDEAIGLFTWDAPVSEDLIGYDVYLDDELVGSPTDTQWQFTGLVNGQTYTAGVSAVYDEGVSNIEEISFTYTGTEVGNVVVAATVLNNNYPNPFNPETNIAYSIKEAGNVTIEVYNLRGQLVKTLVNETKETGDYTATWSGTDNSNKSVSSGVYFYKMKSGNYTSTKKMILMK